MDEHASVLAKSFLEVMMLLLIAALCGLFDVLYAHTHHNKFAGALPTSKQLEALPAARRVSSDEEKFRTSYTKCTSTSVLRVQGWRITGKYQVRNVILNMKMSFLFLYVCPYVSSKMS
jgi:hypothetical protein